MAWEVTHLLPPVLLVLLVSGEGQGKRAEGKRRGRWLGDMGTKGARGGEGRDQRLALGHILNVDTKKVAPCRAAVTSHSPAVAAEGLPHNQAGSYGAFPE